ncbi:hypothetical protein K402DRAFT_424548 [Aulographum hederae CBS 113979]|uniref:Hydrophobin n=1 Tax=Aulographum hederae CBS 113979 TaxID=1176131 RepID=A0A6G1GNE4_9PEZI|nr:hypothetical protein K402DRAFT_424548 [Aulographum hederae CBS 113979]
MRFTILSAIFFALSAIALPTPTGGEGDEGDTCNESNQSMWCMSKTTGLLALPLLSLLNECSSNQQPVCCTGNTFTGLIAIGCTPINVNI